MRSLGLCERTEKPCNHGMVAVSLVEPTLIQILSLLTQRVLNWVPQVVYLHSGCTVLSIDWTVSKELVIFSPLVLS